MLLDSDFRAVGLPKPTLKAWFNEGHIVPFDPGKPGHVATNYSRWFGPEGDQAYPVQYQPRYEPWVFCDRTSIPWHDHLFKGYGLNKVSSGVYMIQGSGVYMIQPPSAPYVYG